MSDGHKYGLGDRTSRLISDWSLVMFTMLEICGQHMTSRYSQGQTQGWSSVIQDTMAPCSFQV